MSYGKFRKKAPKLLNSSVKVTTPDRGAIKFRDHQKDKVRKIQILQREGED